MPVQDNSISGREPSGGSCPVCGGASVELTEFKALGRVTSDCRAWPAGGRLAVCRSCALVFKPADSAFRKDAADIYSSYAIYHQSGGREQRVRHPRTGSLDPRSTVLTQMLLEKNNLSPAGSLLDVGCGNGAFLKAFAGARPGWELRGTEHDARHAPELAKIKGFKQLFTDLPDPKAGTFDLISLIHVLEHVEEPVPWLARIRSLLSPNGILFIECPDAELNPFDLLTADHAMHFSKKSLEKLVLRAGLTAAFAQTPWIAKEISAVCRPGSGEPPDAAAEAVIRRTRDQLAWLRSILEQARALSEHQPIGCFGTSIAGTWLAGQLGDRIGFFVDEDPDRAGSRYLERPVLNPSQIPAGTDTLIALAPETAASVHKRLTGQYPARRLVLPSTLQQTGSII